MEAWWWAVAMSDHQWLKGWAENHAPRIPVVTVGESDPFIQLVGSTPQQTGRSTMVEERVDARPSTHVGTVCQCGQPPKPQVTIVGRGGSPPSSPDKGALNSDGYSTLNETAGHQHHCQGHRWGKEKK